jgi:hypothetical protein
VSATDPDIADLEVRILPLLKGVPGTIEGEGAYTTSIDIEDTILVEQCPSVEVNMAVDEGRAATVVLSSHDWRAESLEPYEHALWIGYWRPGEVQAETVFCGQMNVSDRFDEGLVILEAQDPTGKMQHHYIRRGDDALNIDKHRGQLEPHAFNFDTVIQAARNTPEQQDREVPVLGLRVDIEGYFADPPFNDEGGVEFERGQEVWDLISTWAQQANGPNMDVVPNWLWPIESHYAQLDLYDYPTDPEAPGIGELGRYLAPVNPDAPTGSEVVWDYGLGNDTLEDCQVDPARPGTHQHVLDRDKAYRETSADADSSADVGVWVEWIEADFTIARPRPGVPADTSPLRELADARVNAYGVPVKHTTIKLRPDDTQNRHFGHPRWATDIPGERIGGHWYLGDYVLVRALRGYRFFEQLVRIVGVKIHRSAPDYLVRFDVEVIPAIGGTPGDDPGEDFEAPVVAITAPAPAATVSGAAVAITATATDNMAVVGVQFIRGSLPGTAIGAEDQVAPYAVTWDSTAVADGVYTLRAIARDAGGNATVSAPVTVTVDNTP